MTSTEACELFCLTVTVVLPALLMRASRPWNAPVSRRATWFDLDLPPVKPSKWKRGRP